jgi:hypothetical protein
MTRGTCGDPNCALLASHKGQIHARPATRQEAARVPARPPSPRTPDREGNIWPDLALWVMWPMKHARAEWKTVTGSDGAVIGTLPTDEPTQAPVSPKIPVLGLP